MKVIITGSLGNISRPLIEKLVTHHHQVTVISHDPQKEKEIASLSAQPAIGSVEDLPFLEKTLQGADAIYTMIPPNFSIPDYNSFVRKVQDNYAKAIEVTSVLHVVNLSSSGSPLAGISPLEHYQNLETHLDQLKGISILHLRPGGFYSNFYGAIGMIKYQGVIGNNFSAETKMVLSHPLDIAAAAFEALDTLSFEGHNIQYIISDEKTGSEIAAILGKAIGREDLRWIELTDDQLLSALVQNGFSADAARHYIVDMGIAIRKGLLDAHYQQNKYRVSGNIRFKAFAEEFARAYGAV